MSLEYLLGVGNGKKVKHGNNLDSIPNTLKDKLEINALTYIRGRSIPNQFIIIDEAQNLSKHEIKTVLTRVGEGSKIVLTGDPHQIDSPHLDCFTNGFSYLIDKLKHSELYGHITLTKCERSAVAQLCADLL